MIPVGRIFKMSLLVAIFLTIIIPTNAIYSDLINHCVKHSNVILLGKVQEIEEIKNFYNDYCAINLEIKSILKGKSIVQQIPLTDSQNIIHEVDFTHRLGLSSAQDLAYGSFNNEWEIFKVLKLEHKLETYKKCLKDFRKGFIKIFFIEATEIRSIRREFNNSTEFKSVCQPLPLTLHFLKWVDATVQGKKN